MKNGLEISEHGNKFWFKNGKLHKEDGPAVEYYNGTKEWHQNGELHREGAPAIETYSGDKYFWIKGSFFGNYFQRKYHICLNPGKIGPFKFQEVYSQEEFERKIKLMLVLQ